MKNVKTAPLTGLVHIDQKLIANANASDIVTDLRQAQIDGDLTNKEISGILNFYLPDLFDKLDLNDLYYLTKSSFALVLKNHVDAKIRKFVVSRGHALNELIRDEDPFVRFEFISCNYRQYWSKLLNDPDYFIRETLAMDQEMAPHMLLDNDVTILKIALETISNYDLINHDQYRATIDVNLALKSIKGQERQLLVLDYIDDPNIVTHFKEHGETEKVRQKASQKLQ